MDPLKFTVEFVDTEVTKGVALDHVVEATERSTIRGERRPCAFGPPAPQAPSPNISRIPSTGSS